MMVSSEKENIEAVTDGDITIKNTVIENLTDPADPAISIDAGGVITIESVQIDGAMASDNTTTGILILCDETHRY